MRDVRIALVIALLVAACGAEEDFVVDRSNVGEYIASLPAPATTPGETIDQWEHFSTSFPGRWVGSDTNFEAGEFVKSQLESYGYTATVREYDYEGSKLRVIEGLRAGLDNSERYTGIVGHYDVVDRYGSFGRAMPATYQGAYDNASGVIMVLSLCELMAQVETDKSIACILFDGEEVSLAGSEGYVEQLPELGYTFDQVFSFDMVGLSEPGFPDFKQHLFIGMDTDALQTQMPANKTFLDEVLREHLGVAEETLSIWEAHSRRSDGLSFKEAGIPAFRFAGGEEAASYPHYHRPGDSVEGVYEFAGEGDQALGRERFEVGFEATMVNAYYTILAYDKFDPLTLVDKEAVPAE